ncbi:MAG: amino acid-binding protein [Proteobacteria bacterium]|nr:amino acid-binding protein [Pseudomonadota bacterium]MBU1737133.1 amino acid-binding protein [Pseudomonadota bacterium]
MQVQQVAVFLENKSGRLAEISHCLAEGGVNIRALSLADTADFGILRLVADNTDKARTILKENGFTVGVTEVVAVAAEDRPGGLDKILQVVSKASLNVEYMYAFTQKSGESGLLLFRFDNQEQAIAAFTGAGIRILSGEEVHSM